MYRILGSDVCGGTSFFSSLLLIQALFIDSPSVRAEKILETCRPILLTGKETENWREMTGTNAHGWLMKPGLLTTGPGLFP